MPITHEQLDSFHRFATEKLHNGGSDLSWPELFDLWRIENPTADQQAEIYSALDESRHLIFKRAAVSPTAFFSPFAMTSF